METRAGRGALADTPRPAIATADGELIVSSTLRSLLSTLPRTTTASVIVTALDFALKGRGFSRAVNTDQAKGL